MRSRTLRDFLLTCHQYPDPLTDELYTLIEPHSVLSPLQSRLRPRLDGAGRNRDPRPAQESLRLALQDRHTGRRLNKAFQRAFNVAKHIRTATSIQRGSVSVGSVAVELAEKIFQPARATARCWSSARATPARRPPAPCSPAAPQHRRHQPLAGESAVALADGTGRPRRAVRRWAAEFEHMDIVISSTSAPHYILDRARLEPLMKLRRNAPLLLIDIAVPRDIEPEVNFLENVYLYNIDDLQTIADDYLKQRQEEVARCEADHPRFRPVPPRRPRAPEI